MKKLIYFAFIGFLISCSVLNTRKSSASSIDDKHIYQAVFEFVDSNNVICFKCDEFASEALDNYTIATFSKKTFCFLNEKREPTVNIHNPVIVDTLYTFYDKQNSIQFYKAQNKDILIVFDVVNPKLKLKGNVKTGMTKAEFVKKFKLTNPILNDVQIENSDGTLEFSFTFEKNRLKRINASLYID